MTIFRKIAATLLDLLRQGITPERIALSLVFGLLIGVIPVLGVTTALCAVLAIPLRLNMVAIQAVNWLVYPLQIALLIPFYRVGERLFDAPRLGLMPADVMALFEAGIPHAISALWDTTLRALVVWVLASLLLAPLLYALMRPLLYRMMSRRGHPIEAAA